MLAGPRGIGLDSSGNLYIADHDNYRVRKLSGGQLTTVAGNGQSNSSGDNGLATSASLAPWDVVVAHNGTLYISDYEFNRIRRVGTNGIISTYAGGFNSGFGGDGGLAVSAKLSHPANLALDATGNLFIADSLNNRVRRVDAGSLTIQTVAGNGLTGFAGDGGVATAARLGLPSGVAVDPSGRWAFISAKDEGRVRMVDSGCAIVGPPQQSSAFLSFWLLGPLALLSRLRAPQSSTRRHGSAAATRETDQLPEGRPRPSL
jgi:DNA-binding beta-propeller fold protein YncE